MACFVSQWNQPFRVSKILSYLITEFLLNFKVYQLKKIRPYITSEIAITIYRQKILPLLDYGDFMIESGPISCIKHLEKLQLKTLKHIDQIAHGQGDNVLYNCYNVQTLTLRWREHINFMFDV